MKEEENSNNFDLCPSTNTQNSNNAEYLNFPCFDENEFIDYDESPEDPISSEKDLGDVDDGLTDIIADNFVCPSERRRLIQKKEALLRYAEAKRKASSNKGKVKKVITIDVDSDVQKEEKQSTPTSLSGSEEESLPLEDFVVNNDNFHYEGYKGVPTEIQKFFAKYNERTGPPSQIINKTKQSKQTHKRKVLEVEEVLVSPTKKKRLIVDQSNTPLITNFLKKESNPPTPTPSSSPTLVISPSTVVNPTPPAPAPSGDVMKLYKRKWRTPVLAPPFTPTPSPPSSIFQFSRTRPPLPGQSTSTRILNFPDITEVEPPHENQKETNLSLLELPPIPCVIPNHDYTALPSQPSPITLLSTTQNSSISPVSYPPSPKFNTPNSPLLSNVQASPPTPVTHLAIGINPSPSNPSPSPPSQQFLTKRWRLHVSTNKDKKLLILMDPNKTVGDLSKEIEERFKKIKPQSQCTVVGIELKDGCQLCDDYLIGEITTDSGEFVAIIGE